SERRVLLAAPAERKSHGHHANYHGKRRHQHRSKARKAGFRRGGPRTENRDQERQDDKGVRPPQGDLYDPHVRYLPPKAPGPTGIGSGRRAAEPEFTRT